MAERDGDVKLLKQILDQGSSRGIFPEKDHLGTLVFQDADKLIGEALCVDKVTFLPSLEEEVDRYGEVETVARLFEDDDLGVAERRLVEGLEEPLREGDPLEFPQVLNNRCGGRRNGYRRCSAFRNLRHDKAVFLQDGTRPCREGTFAVAEEEEPLAVEHPADGLFRGDDPVGKDQDFRFRRQGQRAC